ncbi:MAG TPA: hydantoinase/oxoprolinase family protein, partial [Stellaceae bacterium]|nr:hydantoinase/oxoprolinase family protein [Stellaceae bacterium]
MPAGCSRSGHRAPARIPGPQLMGAGGTAATVTDANVVLGRLNLKTLLGGRMAIHLDKAEAAMDNLPAKLGVDRFKAAAGVVEIINVNMMGAVRVISVEQGEDPRNFTLVAFGGAGPLHAADVARSIGMRNVLVPPRPGLLSAIGLLHAEVRGDFSLTRLVRTEASSLASLKEGFATPAERGAQWLKGEGEKSGAYGWFADLRYFGQNFELIIELSSDKLDTGALQKLVEAFHRRHKDYYGYDMRDQPVEIVNLRLVVTGERKPVPVESADIAVGTLKSALLEKRKVWFPETGYVVTPVYNHD